MRSLISETYREYVLIHRLGSEKFLRMHCNEWNKSNSYTQFTDENWWPSMVWTLDWCSAILYRADIHPNSVKENMPYVDGRGSRASLELWNMKLNFPSALEKVFYNSATWESSCIWYALSEELLWMG